MSIKKHPAYSAVNGVSGLLFDEPQAKAWANLTEEQLASFQAALSNTFFEKHSKAFVSWAWKVSAFLGLAYFLYSLFFVTTVPIPFGLWMLAAPVAAVLSAAFVGLVVAMAITGIGSALTDSLSSAIKPLSGYPHLCKEALEIIEAVPDAKAYRDEIVAKGRSLRYFDYQWLRRIQFAQSLVQSKADQELACKKLHGVA